MRHHAFVVEAEAEEGIKVVQEWAARELGMQTRGNPDIIALRHGLFSVEDARRVTELAASAPFAGEFKVLIVSAHRAYHEAQNALLKLFEEPPEGVYLFLILPNLGGLLPTLCSRVHVLGAPPTSRATREAEGAAAFMKAGKEARSALIKKLASGKDEEARRANREEALRLINGMEAAAYAALKKSGNASVTAFLSDIATVRGYLYDRSAPVRMILEHLSLVMPKNLL